MQIRSRTRRRGRINEIVNGIRNTDVREVEVFFVIEQIDGEEFVLAHHGDWHEPTERAIAIRYRDWSGQHQLRALAQLTR